jgi:hypothetical protein
MSFAIDEPQRRRILSNVRALFSLRNAIPHDFDIITGARDSNDYFACLVAYNQTNTYPKIRINYRTYATSQAGR